MATAVSISIPSQTHIQQDFLIKAATFFRRLGSNIAWPEIIPETARISMENFLKDIRYGIRLLYKSPGFTIVAAFSLALAIGANTTIFSIINAVFLNTLPVSEINELVVVSGVDQNNNVPNLNLTPLSWLNVTDYQKQNEVFSNLSG